MISQSFRLRPPSAWLSCTRRHIRPSIIGGQKLGIQQHRLAHYDSHLQNTRNIGIIAHVDAVSFSNINGTDYQTDNLKGKTTTTERMLFYSGVTQRVGGKTHALETYT